MSTPQSDRHRGHLERVPCDHGGEVGMGQGDGCAQCAAHGPEHWGYKPAPVPDGRWGHAHVAASEKAPEGCPLGDAVVLCHQASNGASLYVSLIAAGGAWVTRRGGSAPSLTDAVFNAVTDLEGRARALARLEAHAEKIRQWQREQETLRVRGDRSAWRWGFLRDRFLDRASPAEHALRGDGSPACGCAYSTSDNGLPAIPATTKNAPRNACLRCVAVLKRAERAEVKP